jgi:hypothetical protein
VTILLVEQNVELGSVKLAGSRDALRGKDRVAQLYLGME